MVVLQFLLLEEEKQKQQAADSDGEQLLSVKNNNAIKVVFCLLYIKCALIQPYAVAMVKVISLYQHVIFYLSHCYTIAWDRLSNQFFLSVYVCMYVCMYLWARLRSHFSTDLHEIW